MLQIECLQRRCEEFLSRSLSISNCITRWRLAHWHSCMHLRDRVSSMLLFETPLPVYHSSSRDTVSTMPCLPPASSSSQYYALSLQCQFQLSILCLIPQCQFQLPVLCLVSLLPVPALSTMPFLPSTSSSSQYYALSPQCQFQLSVLCLVSLLPVPALFIIIPPVLKLGEGWGYRSHGVCMCPSVCPCVWILSIYLLNHSTFCNQTWYAGASLGGRVLCIQICLLSSRTHMTEV